VRGTGADARSPPLCPKPIHPCSIRSWQIANAKAAPPAPVGEDWAPVLATVLRAPPPDPPAAAIDTGAVAGVEIIDARPRCIFDRCVVRALSRRQFEPDAGARTGEVEVAFSRNGKRALRPVEWRS